jgi:hypothetical protein
VAPLGQTQRAGNSKLGGAFADAFPLLLRSLTSDLRLPIFDLESPLMQQLFLPLFITFVQIGQGHLLHAHFRILNRNPNHRKIVTIPYACLSVTFGLSVSFYFLSIFLKQTTLCLQHFVRFFIPLQSHLFLFFSFFFFFFLFFSIAHLLDNTIILD